MSTTIDVYVEIGQKPMFAGALDLPGWCRNGHDEQSALHALFDSGPRYADVLSAAQIPFHLPAMLVAFVVVERLADTTTTEFGAPDRVPSRDVRSRDAAELEQLQRLLMSYWQAFDTTIRTTTGRSCGRARVVEGATSTQ